MAKGEAEMLAPTAWHRLSHPEGEVATARGAGPAGATFVVSSLSTRRLQDIAKGDGLLTLWDKGLRRVVQGETTIEEILRVIGMEGF